MTFDDKIQLSNVNINGYITATSIKSGTTNKKNIKYCYFNGRLTNKLQYQDKLSGETRPGYFWLPVIGYRDIANRMEKEIQAGSLIQVIDSELRPFNNKDGEQTSVRLLLKNFKIVNDTAVIAHSGEMQNPFITQPHEVIQEEHATIISELKVINTIPNCEMIEKNSNRIDLINNRVHSMGLILIKRSGSDFYYVYPSIRSSKEDPMKYKGSHSIGKVYDAKDAKRIVKIFGNFYNLSIN